MRYITRSFSAPLTIVPCALTVIGIASTAAAQDDPAVVDVSADVSAQAAVAAPVPTEPPPPPEPEVAPKQDSALEVNYGVGIRTEIITDFKSNNGGDDPVYTANANVRPYISGKVHENIKFEGNLDGNSNGAIAVLDAVLKFEFNDYANIWVGHFLPPSDRANLSGPYFQNAWVYPLGQHLYPSQAAGRDDGFAYWGQYNGGQVKWQLGVFNMAGGTPDPRLAARVTVNLLDPEPGYYHSSTYYGSKDVLAIGAVLQHQPAPEGAPDEAANTLWNLDLLYENTFPGSGTLDIEGAFYGFGGADAGTSFSLLASFLLANKMGPGQLQPMARFQRVMLSDGDTFAPPPGGPLPFSAPGDGDASRNSIDVGLQYIIDGHNARLAATVSHTSTTVGDLDSVTDTVVILGGQVQVF